MKHLLGWLVMFGIGAGLLLFLLVWIVASWRAPDNSAPRGEELAIGFFDPHLFVRLVEVTELAALPDLAPPANGHRRIAVLLEVRSSAVASFADPSRLAITVRGTGGIVQPSSSGAARIDDIRVQTRFEDVLEIGGNQQAWFLFDLPTDLASPELWLSRDSWLARNLKGWEAGPLHDKAVFELELELENADSEDSAPEQECPDLVEQLTRIDDVLAKRPEDATLHFYRALVLARCGDVAGTLASLARVETLGEGFLPAVTMGFRPVWEDAGFQAAVSRLEARLPEVTRAEVAFSVEGPDLIPEGIAFDPATGRLFLGSIYRHAILVLETDGTQRQLLGPEDGLGEILGLVVDGPRGRLLAIDSGIPRTGEAGKAEENGADARAHAVLEVDLDTGQVIRRLAAEGAQFLNDVTAAPDGTIYATDSGSGTIRCSRSGEASLAPCFAAAALPGANGLAVSPSGDHLFVAHSTGVARITIATGETIPRIANETRQTLGGIDGLYARGDKLYGVQNVTNPGRVIEIELDSRGDRAISVRTLLSHHHPALAVPTTAALAGDRLLILANSHADLIQPDGRLDPAAAPGDPIILSVSTE